VTFIFLSHLYFLSSFYQFGIVFIHLLFAVPWVELRASHLRVKHLGRVPR
jgi:hypothetical protein